MKFSWGLLEGILTNMVCDSFSQEACLKHVEPDYLGPKAKGTPCMCMLTVQN